MAVDRFAIGESSCSCTCGGTFVVTCNGCGGIALAGESIQVWDHSGGTLLATLTADGSGNISLAAGTYWLITADARFVGQNKTVSGATSVTFSAASGYNCLSCCAIPLSNTLHYTDNIGTAITLTYSATQWVGTGSVAIPGSCCASQRAGSTTLVFQVNVTTAGHFTPSFYPNSAPAYSATAIGTTNMCPNTTCPPSFSYSQTFSGWAANCSIPNYVCLCATTYTSTLTE